MEGGGLVERRVWVVVWGAFECKGCGAGGEDSVGVKGTYLRL